MDNVTVRFARWSGLRAWISSCLQVLPQEHFRHFVGLTVSEAWLGRLDGR